MEMTMPDRRNLPKRLYMVFDDAGVLQQEPPFADMDAPIDRLLRKVFDDLLMTASPHLERFRQLVDKTD